MGTNLHEVIGQAVAELDEIEAVREIAIKNARTIIKLSRKIIHMSHLGSDVKEEFKKLREEMLTVRGLCEKIDANKILPVLEDAYQEFGEVCIFLSVLRGEPLPSHKDLGITPGAYLLACGDVIGELRRYCLNCLKKGDVEKGTKILEMMEEIYSEIEVLDYPAALVPVKHKIDVARSIIDKTRSDVAYAVMTRRG
ncbi:MAG: translin family protein [Thermoplasmata archaeon]|nr:translin family protein [Thermoplasmata archaeon]